MKNERRTVACDANTRSVYSVFVQKVQFAQHRQRAALCNVFTHFERARTTHAGPSRPSEEEKRERKHMLTPAVPHGEALAECVAYVNTEHAVFGCTCALGSASSQPSADGSQRG